jgi:hypothetical protein
MAAEDARLARDAAAYMAEHGHCKGVLWDDDGRVCFNGALMNAMKNRLSADWDNWRGAVRDVRIAAGTVLRERGYTQPACVLGPERYGDDDFLAIRFNNDETVTGEDVILLLKETTERLEADAAGTA